MSSTLFRFIVRRVAKTLAKRGIERAIEEATGLDVPLRATELFELIRDQLGEEPDQEQLRRALENEQLAGEPLTRRDVEILEGAIMTDFNTFMSIGLNQCGSDRQTFAQLVEVWNREKDDIRAMSQREVRENLTCP